MTPREKTRLPDVNEHRENIILLLKEAITRFTFLLLRNGYLEHKEYFLDNDLEIYSSQIVENLIIMYSKEELILFSRVL